MRGFAGCFVALLLVLLSLPSAHGQPPKGGRVRSPLSPAEALRSFQIEPGYRIEPTAVEPDVVDPVAIAFDERGQLWVVEMGDYPTGERGESRIKILHDPDGDGRYTLRTVFASGLRFVHGVLPWKDGAIVTMAPYILFLRDTDGDGRADSKEVWYRGFAAQNPQLRVNHPTFALDNWVYAANGLRGGQVVDARRSGAPVVSLRARDFRFDPLSGRYEAVAGNGQFGLTFDEWGHRFICSNRNHIKQVVLELKYLTRFAYLPVTVADVDIPDHGAAAKLFTISGNWTTSNLHRGTFTAACGICVYVGGRLSALRGSSFTCDPTANVVHRDVLTGDGPVFVARREPKDREFLASPDNWFRPVNLANGPDGALYVVDMYRAVIEHPDFMPPELRRRPDLYDGNDRGRIWRIRAADGSACRPDYPLPLPEDVSPVTLLESRNGWWRRLGQRLIVQEQRRDLEEEIRKLARSAPLAETRVQALWTLQGIGRLTADDVCRGLDDPHPRVRENALRLVETLGAPSELREPTVARLGDPSAAVVFQAVLTSGEYPDVPVSAYADVLRRFPDDGWMRLAVGCSAGDRAWPLIRALVAGSSAATRANRAELLEFLGELVGGKNDSDEIRALLAWCSDDSPLSGDSLYALLAGLANGLARRRSRLAKYFTDPLAQKLADRLVTETRTLLREAPAPTPPVRRAVALLSEVPGPAASELLASVVRSDRMRPELRVLAIHALGRRGEASLPPLLLDRWRRMTLAERRAVVEVLARRRAYVTALIEALENGTVTPAEIGTARLQQLRRSLPGPLRERLEKVIARYRPPERTAVIERYRVALRLKPDFARGRELFREKCATCHKVAGMGNDVGPDISDTRTRTSESLLVDILDPNRAIDADYVNYLVVTKDGRVYTGIIAGETATAITLVRGANEKDTILKEQIEEIVSSGKSLMPEGFEQELSPQDLADIIGYLKNWRYIEQDREPAAPPVPGVNVKSR